MKFLVFSDNHIYEFQQFSTILSNGLNSRLQSSLDVLDLIIDYANDNDEIKGVLHGGDFFHTKDKISWLSLSETVKRVKRLRKPSVWASGNHDLLRGGSKLKATSINLLTSFSGISDYTVDWHRTFARGVCVWAVPFNPDFKEQIKAIEKIENKSDIILLTHGEVTGAVCNRYRVTRGIPRELLSQFAFSIVGHLHHPEITPIGERILIPGSPCHQTWNDVGVSMGVWVIDVQNGNEVTIDSYFEIDAPEFIEVGEDEIDGYEFKDKNFYRVVTDKKIDLPKNAISISKKRAVLERSTTQLAIDNAEELVKQYVTVKGGEDKIELKKIGLELINF